MPYIGKAPSSGIRSRFIYTATAGQTTFTGADDNNKTLGYTDSEYVDVYLNGVLLEPADYTATSKTSVVLDSGATVGDTMEIVVYDTFSVFNGTFSGDVSVGDDLTISDKIVHAGDTNTTIRFPAADTVTVETAGSERVRVLSDGKIGLGTTTPENPIEIETANTLGSTFTGTTHGEGLRVTQSSYSSGNFVSLVEAPYQPNGVANVRIAAMFDGTGSKLSFGTSNSYGSGITNEAMRIDSSGNVLVGTTSNDPRNFTGGTYGSLLNAGQPEFAVNAGMFINQATGSDGTLIAFRKEGSTVGGITTLSGDIIIGTGDAGISFNDGNNAVIPAKFGTNVFIDNYLDLGATTHRWDDVRATNGTIQTSDANEKQQIASLTDAEITAAKAISKLFKTFKWNDKVEAKGDAARTHTGVIAQEVQQAMTDAGLDATKYAFWCSDTWWETQTEVPAVEADEENGIEAKDAYTRTDTYNTAEEAPEGATERTRLGIRYPELLAFIGAATEQRLADIETRLTALEAE